MKTRRTKRTKQTRKGSGRWFTQPIRKYTRFDRFGPSTSKLAREIHTLFHSDLIHDEIVFHLRDMLERNRNVNQKNLLKDLEKLGIKKHSYEMNEIEAELQYTLPRHDRREHT